MSAEGRRMTRTLMTWLVRLVLLAFNHLFAGLEAYVSGHLSDCPGDLTLQAVPGGAGGVPARRVRARRGADQSRNSSETSP